ncbi:MAG TPA: AraC family transcriptional regulator [Pyrinomonadaceae bacterium]|nr:AraC family transcriptional regulator [Pyrinomonadaceae bacterium]
MALHEQPELIKAWRPLDVAGVELRRGIAVKSGVPRHWHEEYQFCLVESGGGELRYRGSDLANPPGSLFMIQPGEVHSNWPYEFGCTYRMNFIDAHLLQEAAGEVYGKEDGLPFFPTTVVSDRRLINLFSRLQQSLESPATTLEREDRLTQFLSDLIVRFAERRAPPQSKVNEPKAVQRVCDFVLAHYDENFSLEDLAKVANLSAFHLNRIFSKQLGMPPHEFQIQVRIARAKALLRAGLPINEVASQTGFADQSHFTRHFKRLVIVTPGHYQQNSKIVQDGARRQ